MSCLIKESMTILYVQNQARSVAFYRALLQRDPVLNVEGMTEFDLDGNGRLGIMPAIDIAPILQHKVKCPHQLSNAPRAEFYWVVDNPGECYERLTQAGGAAISSLSLRPWGDEAAYGLDPDGYLLAFARHKA